MAEWIGDLTRLKQCHGATFHMCSGRQQDVLAGFAPMLGVGKEDEQLQRELMSGVIRGSMVKTLSAMQEMLGTLV